METIKKLTVKLLALFMLALLVCTFAAAGMASAATITVNPAGGAMYTTITAAVAAASPYDTIECAAGTYTAGANLNKPLTLKGAQAGVDARDGRPGAQESVITAGGLGVFSLNAVDITFDGFTFSNLKGRTLDTYFNADNFTMRNCILQGSSIDPGYNTGAIQFGGGQNLHANGLLFEQNLVTADNGQLFYMGHAMDNGTFRNNKFNGDSVSFGPFGTRTGWVIEGNEFDGNVPGHGPYWGFGFNANLGDVVIQNNNVHEMVVGLGQISVVGGTIANNTFNDNSYAAFQLWGGEWGSVVSANVLIEKNSIAYNGTACTGFADASHAIRLRQGEGVIGPIDASTIHIQYNNFTDLGVGVCGQAWAIRQGGSGTADADLNWWGTTDTTIIATMFGQGAVDYIEFLCQPYQDGVDPWVSIGAVCMPPDSQGPITSAVMPMPNPVPAGGLVSLTATVDDTTTGGSNIQSAEYRLDGAAWYPMAAQDSAFDEISEGVTASFNAPTVPGIYDLCIRGTDVLNNIGAPDCVLFIVYDPTGGFVTGGGWINSPAGADTLYSEAVGRANFGFVSKYKKGATVPTGTAEFQFKAGDLNFHSNVQEWLIVNQNYTNAQFKGTGTINGEGVYMFMIWAGDGGKTGSPDTFRIKIWDAVTGAVRYDNGVSQPISSGSIVIHK